MPEKNAVPLEIIKRSPLTFALKFNLARIHTRASDYSGEEWRKGVKVPSESEWLNLNKNNEVATAAAPLVIWRPGCISSARNTLFMSPSAPATKHQTAHLRVAVHKVGRPVHGVDDPRGVFSVRLVLGDGSATTLLTDEPVKVCID